MTGRKYSLQDYFESMTNEIVPKYLYNGGDVQEWSNTLQEKILDLLGAFPTQVPLNPQVLWTVEEDGLIKQKIVIDSEEHASIPLILVRRSDLKNKEDLKAILCLHGHGPETELHRYGKSLVVGSSNSRGEREAITDYNYDYAVKLAKDGFVTVTFDFRNFGERHDKGLYPGRDSCNVHFIRGSLMGINLITLNLWDCMKVLDYIETLTEIDSSNIGCVGLSFGGTIAMHAAALDRRIKAVCVSSALSTYKEYAIRMGNFCGSQFIPGIYRYADLPDIAGLIAPRDLMIEAGVNDPGFPIESTLEAYNHLRHIYSAMKQENRLSLQLYDGAHQYYGDGVCAFFRRTLEG